MATPSMRTWPPAFATPSTPRTSVSSAAGSVATVPAKPRLSTSSFGVTTTSEVVPANRLVNVELRVSVKISVPTTKPTPSTMATPERTRRSLW